MLNSVTNRMRCSPTGESEFIKRSVCFHQSHWRTLTHWTIKINSVTNHMRCSPTGELEFIKRSVMQPLPSNQTPTHTHTNWPITFKNMYTPTDQSQKMFTAVVSKNEYATTCYPVTYDVHAWLQSSNEMNTVKQSLYTTDHARSDNFRKGATNESHFKYMLRVADQSCKLFKMWLWSMDCLPDKMYIVRADKSFFRVFTQVTL